MLLSKRKIDWYSICDNLLKYKKEESVIISNDKTEHTNTTFLEKSYMVATILYVKNKYFFENFVTIDELNYITNSLQQIFNNYNFNTIITDKIDTTYFEINNVILSRNSNKEFFELIKNRYQGFCPINILKILWDEQLILDEMMNFKLSQIDNAIKVKTIRKI